MALARNYITEETQVSVKQAMPLGTNLVICVFDYGDEDSRRQLEDIFNCSDENARKQLLECSEANPVLATVTPDSSDDEDGHPSIGIMPVA